MPYLYSGPRLLVPVLVDAMIVDQANLASQNDSPWARNPANYEHMNSFEAAFPRSFATTNASSDNGNLPDKGVHLQWILPDSLVSAQQPNPTSDPGAISFKQVPNRWLIVRIWENGHNALQYKGWVVVSNLIDDAGTSPFLQNSVSKGINTPVPTNIGVAYSWEDWASQTLNPAITSDNTISLIGMGPYNAAFNSYTIDNQNVFSFVDNAPSASDLGVAAGALSDKGVPLQYLVMGWYDDPEKEDPVYRSAFSSTSLTSFIDNINKLDFVIGGSNGLKAALSSFGTAYPEGSASDSPVMLCHGAIHSINWYGSDNTSDKSNSSPGTPTRNEMNLTTVSGITIGNTAFDALAAFLRAQFLTTSLSEGAVDFAIDLLYSVYYRQLKSFTENNGPGKLSETIHESWFEPVDAGSYWEINLAPDAEQSDLSDIPQAVLADLTNLNKYQTELEQYTEEYNALVRELYLAVYGFCYGIKFSSYASWVPFIKPLLTSISAVQAKITPLTGTTGSIATAVKSIESSTGFTAGDGLIYVLKELPKNKFWQANDPVVLIHAAKTNNKYGYNQSLECRLSGQTITNLKLNNTSTPLAPTISLPGAIESGLSEFPKELKNLILEQVLLNPSFSTYLNSANAATVAKQQTMIWNSEVYEGFDVATLMQYAGYTGVRPSFRSFQTYTPPWSPLYIDWVTYFAPNAGSANHWMVPPSAMASDPSIPLNNWNLMDRTASDLTGSDVNCSTSSDWSLEGSTFDYKWNPSASASSFVPPINTSSDITNNTIQVSGRSLLSSHLPSQLKTELQKLDISKYSNADQQTIQTVISIMDGFDIITQRLSGFNEYLTKYDFDNAIPPGLLYKTLKKDFNEAKHGFHLSASDFTDVYTYLSSKVSANFPLKTSDPNTGDSLFDGNHFGIPSKLVSSDNNFFPVRSGHLLMHWIRVVDDFGIAYYPDIGDTSYAKKVPSDDDVIPKGIGMDNAIISNIRWAQLPPRLQFPSKMTMDWVENDITSDAPALPPNPLAYGKSSICGWLVPNHLDKSIMIFDDAGHFLTSLMIYEKTDKTFAMAKTSNPLNRSTISNTFLNGLVQELLGMDGASLNAFMEQIDVTMWYTNPQTPHSSQSLTALLGRPLALVRSRVSFTMSGVPKQNFSLSTTSDTNLEFTPYSPTISDKHIPDPYGLSTVPFQFYIGVPHLPGSGLIGYFKDQDFSKFYVPLKHSSISNSFVVPRCALTTTLNNVSTAEPVFQYFTMLVDYRGKTHTVSGLNPVFSLILPQELYENALANMKATFRVGPIITDPTQLRMPKPFVDNTKFSFVYQSSDNIWPGDTKISSDPAAYENKNIENASETAMFPGKRNTVNEGWMELNDITISDGS